MKRLVAQAQQWVYGTGPVSKRSLNCPFRIAMLKSMGLEAPDILGAHQIDRFVVNEYAAYMFFVSLVPSP